MALAEAGVLLFEERHLLAGKLDRRLRVAPLERQPAVVRLPSPLSFSSFWMVIAERRAPSSASIASSRLQPWDGCYIASSRMRATVSAGVVCGWDLWTGGRSF